MAQFPKRFLLVILLLLAIALPGHAAQAQDDDGITDILSINVEAGFGGYFRTNWWFPLRVRLYNQGADLTGRLVVRPETSGDAIYNTYSTPVDLPTGSQQVVTLYVAARSHAREIRVELITDAGSIATTGSATLRNLDHRERLYVVVSDTPTGTADLTSVSVAGYSAQQALWDIEEIPNRTGVLDSIDAILFSDVDTGALSPSQRDAIRQWVLRGGHLIVTGGTAWQATASGLEDLLPLVPNTSALTSDLAALEALSGHSEDNLAGDVVVARGELRDDAVVLAAAGDGEPLIARRFAGNGTVDYLSIDLSGQPLRRWDGMDGLWFTLLTSTNPNPGWAEGILNYGEAITAVEILPGVNLLPAAMSLIGFLLAYILLIGPVNYIILSRLNRRELAWFSIPILIVAFSAISWSFGAELRGNDVTLSRLSVVQTWPDSDEARLDQLIGLLAPRRGDYSLEVEDERLLRPISSDQNDFSFLSTNSAVDIRQGTSFEAVNFPVDASFIQAFSTNGTIPKPDIGGRLSLVYADEQGEARTSPETISTFQPESGNMNVARLQGSVFNNADFTLHNPVILARGQFYPLDSDLEPGDLVTQNLVLYGNSYAPASPLELSDRGLDSGSYSSASGYSPSMYYTYDRSEMTTTEIMGDKYWQQDDFRFSPGGDSRPLEFRRNQALLNAFIADQFGSTGRGDRVFLVGWGDKAPTDEQINGGGFTPSDSTLYIAELAVETPTSGSAHIAQDQFTWVTLEREGVGDDGPNGFDLGLDDILSVRYTPVPTARLSRIDELTILLTSDQRYGSSNVSVEVWDWDANDWELVRLDNPQNSPRHVATFYDEDARRFTGPNNAVEVRVAGDFLGQTQARGMAMAVEQTGRF